MKKIWRRATALLLTLLILFGIMPMGIISQSSFNDIDTSTVSISNNTSMGRILNQTLNASSSDNDDFSISYIVMDGKKATVSLNNSAACKIVVAIYDSDTDQMLASGITDIEENAGTAQVNIDIPTMPQYYIVRAFALGQNYNALCEKYESLHYTKEFERFYNTTPDDFDETRVIIMQETPSTGDEDQIDFGVIADDVQKANATPSMKISYDLETHTYLFKNATEEIKNLKPGDKYFYKYGESFDEFVLFKIASITVLGSTVQIKEDEVALADVFKYLRVDAEADYEHTQINEIGQGFTLLDEEIVSEQGLGDIDENFKKSQKIYLSFDLKPESVDQGSLSGSAKGTLTATTENSARVYYDARWGKDYYEIKSDNVIKAEGKITFTGAFDIDKFAKIPKVDISIPVSAFDLEFKIELDISASINASFAYSLSKSITVTKSSNNKLNTTMQEDKELQPDGDISGSVELKIGIKVTLGLSLYIPFHGASLMKKGQKAGIDFLDWPYKKVTGLSFTGALGLKLSGKSENISALHPHVCLSGTINFYYSFSGSLMVNIVPHVLEFNEKVDFINGEKPLWDFYLSFSPWKFKTGKPGTVSCPEKYHKVSVKVTDAKGNPIKDVTVTAPNCICDADSDGQYNETQIQTNEEGLASIYLKQGEHTVSATYDNETKSTGIKIINIDQTVSISFTTTVPGNPDQPDVGSDGMGSNDGIESDTIIRFGSYPQSDVTESIGSTPAFLMKAATAEWKSYKYYSGYITEENPYQAKGQMTAKDYMQYCDVIYDGNKYRGVTFGTYRPIDTFGVTDTSGEHGYQDDNGYQFGKVYWFKYEPLRWKILDASTGLLLCETIIDSQPFNNYCYYNENTGESWGNPAQTYYSSDYANSSIRQWLRELFYATAFSEAQQSKVLMTTLQNNGYYTSTGITGYENLDSKTTNDKVFLLSFDDFRNNFDKYVERVGSDYAKCQGLFNAFGGTNYNNYWWLRSTGRHSGKVCVVIGGTVDGRSFCDTSDTFIGVCPALRLNLAAFGIKKTKSIHTSALTQTDSNPAEQTVENKYYLRNDETKCVPGNSYVLLNVTGYHTGFTLTTQNLEFIDQLSADSNGVIQAEFVPRKQIEGSTTLLVGDFGNGIESRVVQTGVSTTTLPTSIAVKTMPTKTTYTAGESLDPSGLALTATYADGSTKTITSGFTCAPTALTETGTQTITVTYEGKTTTFTVTVLPKGGAPSIKILKPSQTTIRYLDTLVLHAQVDNLPPEAKYVIWSTGDSSIVKIEKVGDSCTVSGHRKDCQTCTITGEGRGTTKITCTVCDASKNPIKYNGKTISSSVEIRSRYNIFMILFLFIYVIFTRDYAY